MSTRRTRLAPSPTGALHLGNARTFALTWALARTSGWEVVLRIEDLDRDRVKPGAIESAVAYLDWLGLDHDGEVTLQSRELAPYRDAMRALAARGRVFRCERSRADVRAASAPHADEGELRFPPTLRPADPSAFRFVDEAKNYRLLVQSGRVRVRDALLGAAEFDPADEVGDFLVWTRQGSPAYQLAVVVDDARQGVSDVVRGDDLLASAARQEILYGLLGHAPPTWWHLPLVYGADGERLAKRHGATSLQTLRERGVRRERVLGLLAFWCAFLPSRCECSLDDFRAFVTPDTLRAMAARENGRGRVRLVEEDLQWLFGSRTLPLSSP